MNELATAIVARFKANTSHAAYTTISGRLYDSHAPQESTKPYAVFSFPVDTSRPLLSADRDEFLVNFQFFSSTPAATEVDASIKAFKARFDDCEEVLSVSGYTVQLFQRDFVYRNWVDDDPSDKYWIGTIQYRCLLLEN